MRNGLFRKAVLTVLTPSAIVLVGCQGLEIQDTASLLAPSISRSEVVGFVAGLGTTFAA